MARLNDPPAPLENIDALKRRFIRQNREIARVNSTQSQRIRNLESEISYLLSENIALRQHIIRLQHEVDRRPGHTVLDDMGDLKGKLEAKLVEIGSLVQELGKIQTDAENRRSPKRRPISNASPKTSPGQKVWKNVLTLAEVTGAEGRLPPIVEDKYFPRKTLDADDLNGMFPDAANMIDSPELGPPPIAHFEDGDPTKFGPSEGDAQPKTCHISEHDIQPAIFANLETRKRRRETSSIRETVFSRAESQNIEDSAATQQPTSMMKPLKVGAKRKLTAAEDEDKRGTGKALEDGFDFDKTHTNPVAHDSFGPRPPKEGNFSISESFQEHGAELRQVNVKETSAPTIKTRKALGPKNVNTDPTSPSKVRKLAVTGKANDAKERAPKRIVDAKRLKERPSNALLDMPKDPDRSNSASLSPDPEQLALEMPATASRDIPSPEILKPSSAVRPTSEDTPPPTDLEIDPSNPESFDATGRATRRPRGGVSYAEPNLRAKMRRPTKGLADAVGGDERPQQVIVIADEEIQGQVDTSVEKAGLRTVIIKKEDFPDSSDPWQIPSATESQTSRGRFNIEACSPLEKRGDARPADESLDHTRGGRTPTVSQPEHKPSGAGSVIAALSAGRPNSRKRDGDEGMREAAEGPKDVFDLSASYPGDGPGEGTDEVVPEGSGKTGSDGVNSGIRSHRRHSSMPGEEGKVGGDGRLADSGLVAKRRERKRESLINPANEGHPATELRSARSAVRLQGKGGTEGRIGRAERAASRRRSMML